MASQTVLLQVISPEGTVFNEQVDEVSLPTKKGEITVLPNHINLFTKVVEGEVRAKKSNSSRSIAITGGFVDVQNNTVKLLSDYAVRAESIEIARAEAIKKKSEAALKEKKDSVDYAIIEKDLQRSILELKVSAIVKKRRQTS